MEPPLLLLPPPPLLLLPQLLPLLLLPLLRLPLLSLLQLPPLHPLPPPLLPPLLLLPPPPPLLPPLLPLSPLLDSNRHHRPRKTTTTRTQKCPTQKRHPHHFRYHRNSLKHPTLNCLNHPNRNIHPPWPSTYGDSGPPTSDQEPLPDKYQ